MQTKKKTKKKWLSKILPLKIIALFGLVHSTYMRKYQQKHLTLENLLYLGN